MARLWRVVEDTRSVVPGLMPPGDQPLPYWSEQILSEQECDDLYFEVMRNYGRKQLSQVYRADGTGSQIDLSSRYTHYYNPLWLEGAPEIERRFNKAASDCASAWWGMTATPVYGSQCLGYEERCKFNLHCDNSLNVVNGWSRNDPLRDLTGLLYLGDKVEHVAGPNQFSGGELVLRNLRGADGKPVTIHPRKGQFVAFPSHPVFRHEVPPITRGYRVALVNWWTIK